MPAIPTLAMPDLVSGPAKLGSSLKESLGTIAQAVQQYGDFKNDKQIRDKAASELDAISPGTGAAWMSATKELPIEDALRGATNAVAYQKEAQRLKAESPDFGYNDAKSMLSILTEAKSSDMQKILATLKTDAEAAKTKTAQADAGNTLADLSQGMVEAGPNAPKVFRESSSRFIGQRLGESAQQKKRPVTQEDLRSGAMQTGVLPNEVNTPVVNEAVKQFPTQKDIDAQQNKKEALTISKYRAKNAAEKALSDKSLKEKMLAIVAGKTNLEAQDRRQMIGILEQDARIKAADPMLEPGQKQEWLQKADDYNSILDYSQENAEVLQDVTSGLFAAIAKKYPDMNTRRPKDVMPKTKSGKTADDYLKGL